MNASRLPLPLAALLILGGLPGLAQGRPRAAHKAAASPAPVQVASVEGITEYRLHNGLRVLLFPDPSKPNLTVNITYLVGSRDESYGETGMAHLLEHMIFKGTDRHPDIPNELTLHGTRPNGTTSYDRTNYFESMKATDENLKWALDLEADRMINSWVAVRPQKAAELLRTEMTVVRNEYEAGENQPLSVLMQRVSETAYLWHNYGKPVIGCRSDIENVDIRRLSAFFRKYYQPDNAVLLVAGKFDPVRTLAMVNAAFGPIPRPRRILEKTYTVEPTQDGERAVTVRRVGDTPALLAAYHVPAGSDPDMAALSVLSQVLGDAPSGRLYKALVEPRKAAFAFSAPQPAREPGLFFVGALLRPEGSLDEARDLLLKATEEAGAVPFSAEEVERAKTGILKDFDLRLSQSDQVGLALSGSIALGDWRTLFLERDRIRAVTPADVARVAAAYLKPSNRTLGTFVPTPRPDRSEIPAVRDVEAMVRDYKGQDAMSQGEAFDASPAAIEARTVRFSTAAGLKVAMVPKKTRGGAVVLNLALHFGTEPALMGRDTAAGMAAGMLGRGTASLTRQAFQDRLDQLKANVDFHGDAEGVYVMAETVRESLPAVLKLITEALREPSFPAGEFESLRQESLAGMESQKSEPTALGGLAFQQLLDIWPKGHPRHAESLAESMADVKAVTLEQAKAFHAAFYGASDGELVLVGDADPGEVRPLVESLLGAWKSPSPYARITAVHQPSAPRSLVLETPDKANAAFFAGLNLAVRATDPDYPALALGNFMLGGGFLNSRLAARIRVKDGLSYGVGSRLQAGNLESFGTWTVSAICAPQNIDKVEAAFREEVARALAGGFTDKEIAEAKSGWLQGQEQSRAQDRELAGRIATNTEAGRTFAFQADLDRKIKALTGEQITAALRRHLVLDALCVVKAGDFTKAPGSR